jgi:hypothetical protein
VGGKKSNIPHSASYIPTLSLNLVQEGDNVTPKRRKRRSDNDFKSEMGRLSAKSDEYFRMPPTEVTSPLEVQGLVIDIPHQTGQVKAKSRKGLPFGMSPNSLLHHTNASIAESLLAKTKDAGHPLSILKLNRPMPLAIKLERGSGDTKVANDVNNASYVTSLSAGITQTISTSSSNAKSKTRTIYPIPIGSQVHLNVPNPATAFSISRTPIDTAAESKVVATTVQLQQPGVLGENVTTAILTPGGYKTVAQLLHEKRVLTNPEQNVRYSFVCIHYYYSFF